MHVLFVAALLASVASSSACPDICTCDNGEVQCRSAGLTSIPEDLGEDTVHLDLSENSITVIRGVDLKGLTSLKKLIVKECGVENIEPEAFNDVQKLELLDLHGNAIRSLHPSVFQNNINLMTLDLSDNKLETFECDIYPSIISLNISGNQLSSENIPNFSAFTSLESLDISYNRISNLSSDIFNGLHKLTHLDISGNPDLEYNCDLRPLWTLCRDNNINCVTDNEQSWQMEESLNCGIENATEIEATEPEEEGYLIVMNSVDENQTVNGEEGSGGGNPDTVTVDPTLEPSIEDVAGEATVEPAVMEEQNWILIVIIVCAVVGLFLVIGIVVICVIRRRKMRVEDTGNISRAHSIQYLNQEDEFNPTYKNSRNNSVKKNDGVKGKMNNFDRVLNPPDYSKPDATREVIPLGDYTTAEIMRVPSFKTQGVSTPLNLPEEIPIASQSLPRTIPTSSYEDNTIRSSSLRRHPKLEQGNVPDIQIIPPQRRVPSNKRR